MSSEPVNPEDLIRVAEVEAANGRYKEAYNVLGHGRWGGGPEDQELRYRRGLYAYNVAHQRLKGIHDSSSPKLTLIKAGCWLARAEAYLGSAAEGVDESMRAQLEDDLERVRREQERFRQLCAEFGGDLFISASETLGDD